MKQNKITNIEKTKHDLTAVLFVYILAPLIKKPNFYISAFLFAFILLPTPILNGL